MGNRWLIGKFFSLGKRFPARAVVSIYIFKYKINYISLFSIWYGLCSHEIMSIIKKYSQQLTAGCQFRGLSISHLLLIDHPPITQLIRNDFIDAVD